MGEQEAKRVAELLAEQQRLVTQQLQWQAQVIQTFSSIRTSNDLSQTAFAKALNTSQSYVWEIEHGSKVPSEETLSKLLNFAEGSSTDGTPL